MQQKYFCIFSEYNIKRISATLDKINTQSQINISQLSEVACLGNKQFSRIFVEHVGAISFAPNFSPSPNSVLIHFNCNDIETTLSTVANKGGEIVTPKTKIEAENRGYFAVFSDSKETMWDYILTNNT